jgi:hypothetical protein
MWIQAISYPANISRYRTGVESALAKADLLKSLDITVLQGFVIYIVRDTETSRGLILADNCFRLAAGITIKG